MRRSVTTLLAAVGLLVTLTSTGQPEEAAGWTLIVQTYGLVKYASADGSEAGWVSAEYLQNNPQPRSGYGCNQNVCIDVTGAGVLVSRWATQAFGNVGCTRAYFHAQSSTVASPTICSTRHGDGVYFYSEGPAGSYQDRDALCNSWEGIAGYPCIEVRA